MEVNAPVSQIGMMAEGKTDLRVVIKDIGVVKIARAVVLLTDAVRHRKSVIETRDTPSTHREDHLNSVMRI